MLSVSSLAPLTYLSSLATSDRRTAEQNPVQAAGEGQCECLAVM